MRKVLIRTLRLQRGARCHSPGLQAARAGSGECGFGSRWRHLPPPVLRVRQP
jgi:hypothetical protein